MGDILTTFAKIGALYLDEEKRVKNKAYEYTQIKTYLCDINSGEIEPYLTIPKEELIITRYGVGANSGNLFPNLPFDPKSVQKDFPKFVRGVLKAVKNLLSCFDDEQINEDEILYKLSQLDETFFASIKDNILPLEKLTKEKGVKGKIATYFSLGYEGRPVSAYFMNIFERHLQKEGQSSKAT